MILDANDLAPGARVCLSQNVPGGRYGDCGNVVKVIPENYGGWSLVVVHLDGNDTPLHLGVPAALRVLRVIKQYYFGMPTCCGEEMDDVGDLPGAPYDDWYQCRECGEETSRNAYENKCQSDAERRAERALEG